MTPKHVSGTIKALTYQQKLEALSLRFYQGLAWLPKAGDYYTTSRADLELYQVVSVEDGFVKTRYCDTSKTDAISSWPEDEFTTGGFGPKRVYVPDFILAAIQPDPEPVASSAVPHSGAVEVCGICDIAGCHHIRDRTATPSSAGTVSVEAADLRVAVALWREEASSGPAMIMNGRTIDTFSEALSPEDQERWLRKARAALRALAGERG